MTKQELVVARYLAFDPGKTTGVAEFNKDAEMCAQHQFDYPSLIRYLEEDRLKIGIDTVVCEDFIHDPTIAQGGQRPWAGIAMGIIESYCYRNKCPLVYQSNKNKGAGYAWGGVNNPASIPRAQRHKWDAYAHGVYWLQENKKRKNSLLKILREGST